MFEENLLPVAQEPLELENRRTGAPLHPGLLEHSVVRAYYLKEDSQLLWSHHQPARAELHPRRWMHPAMRSRVQPSSNWCVGCGVISKVSWRGPGCGCPIARSKSE